MTEFLIGGYGADMGGTGTGIGWGRSHPDGRFEYRGVAAEVASPSWIAVDGDRVHATLEGVGEVASWRIEGGRLEGGRLDGSQLIETGRVTSGGANPCHLAVAGDELVVSNYSDGVVAVIGAAGLVQSLVDDAPHGPLPAQGGPHAHHALALADGRVLTVDLGTDRLHVYEWTAERSPTLSALDTVPLPEGTGPRDLLLLPDGRLALLAEWSCELFLLEPRGMTFEVVQILQLPGATRGDDQAAALGLSADGRHLVAGIRGADRIATVALGAEVGGDVPVAVGWVPSGGVWPRHLVVDGEYVHVANQLSSTVTSFRLDADGRLSSLGAPVAVPSPTCLAALR